LHLPLTQFALDPHILLSTMFSIYVLPLGSGTNPNDVK